MTSSIRCTLGYCLRSGETRDAAAARLGATAAAARDLGKGVIELPVTIDLAVKADKVAKSPEAAIAKRFPGAAVTHSTSNGVSTWQVSTADETFDVTVRGERLYLTTFDGFGGLDEIRGADLDAALGRAYDAYRAVLAARKL